MSNLNAFLKPAYTEKTIEVVISDRFLDEEGKPVPFILKSMKQEQLQALAKRSTHERKVNGRTVQEFDKLEHINRCIIASCVQPCFTDRELCLAYGTEDPLVLPQKMLLVSEYERLARAFAQLNGLETDEDEAEAIGEVTKN